MYTKKVIKHFQKPKNYGKIKNPDGVGKVGNVICGDVMWLYIKVGKNKKGFEVIKDIKFETFGCVAALATSSVVTELAKGKTLTEATEIDKEKIIRSLGGLPPIKIHCSVLAVDALSEAIHNYLMRKNRKIPEELEKRHQRIEKEKKLIEEKYKDWIKAEEKIHGRKK
ncbi:MAG: iron-sulfur cluster assembly scaffold protein [Candidatus Staskawiczbacteria bacterium CG10_big_fil_rev_8_21_14_0_10_38_10]|uniref:Iron-sulfur cluster assembly scaffold protein n=1 Tax=Candidatus Staskawiczbacteria bacterium CG10_big_fil_rev_8_21_14_0_10_38_10 TaxID=1974891 RepID=A0A2H9T1B3_9BACT|nr:MAG: iron-sulfur cluster assembly scaffold protein [Candidatus Staskawiczbacteria bacterium CG10_big_fil_rev_8_21_14_0_10_38_10]